MKCLFMLLGEAWSLLNKCTDLHGQLEFCTVERKNRCESNLAGNEE